MSILVPSARPFIQVGGCVFTDLTNLKQLFANAVGNTEATFRLPNGSSGYTPTGTFTARCFKVWKDNNSGNFAFSLLSSANDVGFNAASGSFTTTTYLAGSSSFSYLFSAQAGADLASIEHPIHGFQVTAGRYMGMKSGSGSLNLYGASVWGYET